jgi:hypothetical protein
MRTFYNLSLLFSLILFGSNTVIAQTGLPNCSAITAPYIETFDSAFFSDPNDPYSLDSCWFQTDFNLYSQIGSSFSSDSFPAVNNFWFRNGFGNVTDTGAISLRVNSSDSMSVLLVSPSINVGSITDSFALEFDLTYTDTNNSGQSSFGSAFGCLHTFMVLFSTDDGATWSTVQGWNDLVFDINNVPDYPSDHFSVLLRDPMTLDIFSGNIRIGFYLFNPAPVFPCSDFFDVHIDNFEITESLPPTGSADMQPDIGTYPIAINGSQTFKALDELCIGVDTSANLIVSIQNNGPFTSLSNQTYLFNSNGDTLLNFNGSNFLSGAALATMVDVEDICPGILDSAYTCSAQLVSYSLIPFEANHSNDTINFQIVSNDAPTYLNINNDTTICKGESVLLNGMSDIPVKWKDGFGNIQQNGSLVSPTVTTTYFATAGAANCKMQDQFKITVINESIAITQTGDSLFATSGFDSYTWTLNGNVVGTTESIEATANGVYTVTGTMNGCEFKESKEVKGISLSEIQKNTNLVLPNPFFNFITIQVDVERADIYNYAGQLIYTTNKKIVDLSELSSGNYHIIVKSKEGIYQQKLLKL